MSPLTWVVIFILVAVNALYVAAEFAAVGVRRSRVRQLAQEGNGLARQLLPVLEDGVRLDRYIAACQIGITISSLVLGAYGQANLAGAWRPLFERFGGMQEAAAQSAAAVAVLIFLTAFQVILGELVPKSLSLQFPTQMALYTVLPMRASVVALSWFIAVLNGSGLFLLKLLGAPAVGHQHIHSPEEISMLIAESRDGGLLEEDEHQRLTQALRLSARPAHQLMVPRRFLQALPVETSVEDAAAFCARSPFTRLPLYEETIDRVVGVLHARDLATHWAQSPDSLPSLREMMRPAVTVSEHLPADALLATLRERKTHLAIVVDEFGGVRGLVTLQDIMAEMLGESDDEYRMRGQPQPERLPDGRVRLPGLMRIDQAERWVGVLWDAPVDTIGGLVFSAIGHLPAPGDVVEVEGVRVEVEKVQDNLIASLLVTPVGDREGAAGSESGRG